MRETKESDTVSLCVDIQFNKSQHVLNPRQGLSEGFIWKDQKPILREQFNIL